MGNFLHINWNPFNIIRFCSEHINLEQTQQTHLVQDKPQKHEI